MDVCACLSGADGWVVEGRKTLFRPPREVGRVRIPAGWATHGCCVVCVLCLCCEKGVERVGVGGRGKYPGAPPHHLKKELADRKDQVVKGEGCREKKKSSSIRNCFGIHDDVQNRQQLNTVV
jgi:hypothetical protein